MSAASKNRKIDSELNGEQVELRGRMKMPNVPKPTEKEKEDMLNDRGRMKMPNVPKPTEKE